jgi:hypothetical protein
LSRGFSLHVISKKAPHAKVVDLGMAYSELQLSAAFEVAMQDESAD